MISNETLQQIVQVLLELPAKTSLHLLNRIFDETGSQIPGVEPKKEEEKEEGAK